MGGGHEAVEDQPVIGGPARPNVEFDRLTAVRTRRFDVTVDAQRGTDAERREEIVRGEVDPAALRYAGILVVEVAIGFAVAGAMLLIFDVLAGVGRDG